MIRILVVEDDQDLNRAVCMHLNRRQYACTGCPAAEDALLALSKDSYDLIISDIMMPRMDGFAFAEDVRALDSNIPILFMTARSDIGSKERGFKLGIDDYMVKPIDLEELVLRVEALLRRAKIAAAHRLVIGNLILDEDEITATVDGESIPVTLREFRILYKLLSYPKRTFTRGQLLDDFGGPDNDSGLRSVDVHITNLRQKFTACNGFRIETVRGLGYKAVLL